MLFQLQSAIISMITNVLNKVVEYWYEKRRLKIYYFGILIISGKIENLMPFIIYCSAIRFIQFISVFVEAQIIVIPTDTEKKDIFSYSQLRSNVTVYFFGSTRWVFAAWHVKFVPKSALVNDLMISLAKRANKKF